MRPRKQSLEVFSVAFLDLLACALGAVLLLLIAKSDEDPEEGFPVPLELAIRLDWDETTDIDLWVKDPSGEFAYFKNDRTAVGYLLRDETDAQKRKWEVYFQVDVAPGEYEIYAHDYDESDGPTHMKLLVVMFPSQPAKLQEISLDSITLTKSESGDPPGKRILRFKIERNQGSHQLIQQ